MSVTERLTRTWLRYANTDLRSARTLLAAGEASNACYLAQQAAEKALKAALIHEQIPYPYQHNLDALRNLLPPGWGVKTTHPVLRALTAWVIEARYPGAWAEPTGVDATDAIADAQGVYDAILADLDARGFVP